MSSEVGQRGRRGLGCRTHQTSPSSPTSLKTATSRLREIKRSWSQSPAASEQQVSPDALVDLVPASKEARSEAPEVSLPVSDATSPNQSSLLLGAELGLWQGLDLGRHL